ncbi:hypothetical protein [Nocardioides sp. AE5]|uniref:hypothetical protein n=1 Tax=Nocardioides sp. AE5 TaxID=2962573 RepID=UPI0028820002|nr:hypothetical protein [Nocardioides sp. AE5]MDT0200452.1 hypothetical protein [Nocardioides sp. AE5]
MNTQIKNPETSTGSSARPVLLLDAGMCALSGIANLAGARLLDDLLGPSVLTLAVLGGVLLVWAVGLDWVAARRPIPTAWVREIALFNLLWVAGSVAAPFLLDLTTIGMIWCVLQAVVVAGFAAVQLRATR